MTGSGIVIAGTGAVWGQQEYPNKPLRMFTAGVGGGNDFLARLIAPNLSNALGQPVLVENRGGSVTVPGQTVASSAPDGYTLLLIGTNFWISPFLEKVPYDPIADFTALTLLAQSPILLVVHPSLPVMSVRQLIDLAKAKPGALSYSTGPTGSSSHIAPELFKFMTGVNMVRIPYKSGATEIADLLGGQVQLTFGTAASVTPHVKSGRLRALAVTSLQPTPLAPGLPTVAAAVPGYSAGSNYGMFLPGKSPAAVINRLHQEVVRILNTADVNQKIFETGVEVVGNSPAEFAAMLKTEMARVGKVIRDAGIRAD
jgi:tripartite-type tricarboxylate transporter receptor subunit TctC